MMWQVMRDLPEKLRWIALIFNHLKNTWIKPEITRKISYNKKYSTAMEECLIYFWFEHVPFVVAYTKLYRANQILFQQNSSVSDICKIHYFQYFFFCFSVWNHIVCFEWLGKNWRQGCNIKVAFLSHLYLSSVVNQCYRFFKNTNKNVC